MRLLCGLFKAGLNKTMRSTSPTSLKKRPHICLCPPFLRKTLLKQFMRLLCGLFKVGLGKTMWSTSPASRKQFIMQPMSFLLKPPLTRAMRFLCGLVDIVEIKLHGDGFFSLLSKELDFQPISFLLLCGLVEIIENKLHVDDLISFSQKDLPFKECPPVVFKNMPYQRLCCLCRTARNHRELFVCERLPWLLSKRTGIHVMSSSLLKKNQHIASMCRRCRAIQT